MSIIRTSHNKDNPYVMLNKNALEDTKMSWAAKGLWAYLMSRPDDWNISVSHLSKIYEGKGGGERAIYSLLNELIECGYCERTQETGDKGQFLKTEYKITEFKIRVPHRSQADAAEADALESPPTNKRVILNKEKQQQQQEVDAAVFPENDKTAKQAKSYFDARAIEWGPAWVIPLHTLISLIDKHGDKFVTDQIKHLSKKQLEAIEDEKSPYSKKKTNRIEKPDSYLRLACEKNYALSQHQKGAS